jgi:anion-transporting  ArsA/GET3 family ATPase
VGAPPNLNDLLATRRVLLCVGCGGVGKTTTCAALGLAAARAGKRVLCLTIDPAKRLAQSLGLERFTTEAQRIDDAVFARAGIAMEGSLTVMMLDTKQTFDNLVAQLSETPERRQRVLDDVLYKYISTSLAGTQEYMAMEKLYEVKGDAAYDIILLDTPPTSHALDFLEAPERLVGAIDSPAVRWFVKAFQGSTLSLNLLKASAAAVLRGLGKITGGGFLEQVASFMAAINDMFGGWRARADEVASALRGPDVGYVLVTTPDPMAIREVLFFAERLREQRMRADAYVVNRTHDIVADASDEQIAAAIARRGVALEPDAVARVAEAAQQERRLGELDRLHLIALEEVGSDGPPIVRVPDFSRDIHDVQRLAWVADVLAPPP